MVPEAAVAVADVYKAGQLAGRMWRVGQDVTFAYVEGYGGDPVASTLPVGSTATEAAMRAPAYFAGLLPEGETRRRGLARSLHVSEDDELGLLIHLGADTVGDVQIVESGDGLPGTQRPRRTDGLQRHQLLATVAARRPVPALRGRRCPAEAVPPVAVAGRRAGRPGHPKFSPDDSRHGVLHNERLFMTAAADAGLQAPAVEIVEDRDGVQALAVARFLPQLARRSAGSSRPGGRVAGPRAPTVAEVRPRRPHRRRRAVAAVHRAACGCPRPAASDALQLRGR